MLRIEQMEQPAALTVGQKFLVDPREDGVGKHLDLSAHLIGDCRRGPKSVGLLAEKPMSPNVSAAGQRLIAGRGNLRQTSISGSPSKDMTRGRNSHRENVVVATHFTAGKRLEQLWMQRAAIEMNRHVAYRRSVRREDHDITKREWVPSRDYSVASTSHNPYEKSA